MLEQAGRDHLGLIAAIAPNCRIYVGGQAHSFRGEDVVWFLSKLCSCYCKRDLLIIWNGASIHNAGAVKAFLKERPERIHLDCPLTDALRCLGTESGRVSLEST